MKEKYVWNYVLFFKYSVKLCILHFHEYIYMCRCIKVCVYFIYIYMVYTHTWNENVEFKNKPMRKVLCLKIVIDINGLLFWHISKGYHLYKWLRQAFCIAAFKKIVNHIFNLYQGYCKKATELEPFRMYIQCSKFTVAKQHIAT